MQIQRYGCNGLWGFYFKSSLNHDIFSTIRANSFGMIRPLFPGTWGKITNSGFRATYSTELCVCAKETGFKNGINNQAINRSRTRNTCLVTHFIFTAKTLKWRKSLDSWKRATHGVICNRGTYFCTGRTTTLILQSWTMYGLTMPFNKKERSLLARNKRSKPNILHQRNT